MRRIFGQTCHNHCTHRIGHLILQAQFPDTLRERLGHFIEHLISDIPAIKGRATGEQLVKCGAQRIEVITGSRQFPTHLLWAHVNRRTTHTALHGGSAQAFGHGCGDPEIRQLQVALPIHQHVGGLKIAMHNLMLMRVLKGIAQLSHQWPQVFPCKQMAGLLQAK